MSDDFLIQHFRAALEVDISAARVGLEEAMAASLGEGDGEIYLDAGDRKRARVREATGKLHGLVKLYEACFPSEKFIRDKAEEYLWERKERKLT
jgi:hypothetical protein